MMLLSATATRAADINAAVAASLNAADNNTANASASNNNAAANNAADLNGAADVAAARAALDQLGEPVDDAGKLAKGIAQYNAHEYEEAVATLQTVNGDQLSAQGKQSLSDTLAKATDAADQRKAARAEFEKGEQALSANQPAVALQHYKNAAANYYADDGTVAKAREQEAVAQDSIKAASAQLKGLYGDAINDYKAGNYVDAKAKFTTLQDAGFRAPLFQRSPSDYLSDINQKLAAMPAATPPAAPATPAAPAVVAPVAATPASPAAPAESVPPTTAPADNGSAQAAAAPANTPAPAPALSPADAYHLARDQYRSGDWINARKNFIIARDGGYHGGWFEDGPEKYLARMDAKEQADAQQHAAELAQQQAAAAAAAAAANAPATQPAMAETPATAPASAEAAATPAPAVAVAPTTAPAPMSTPTGAAPMADASTQPATQPAAVAMAPAVVPAAPPAPAMPDPDEAYHLARRQYRNGDWIAARQNFVIARDGGYKPGLFEDSPAKYLARMDAKEQADDLKHQEEIRQQQMMAAAAAAATPATTQSSEAMSTPAMGSPATTAPTTSPMAEATTSPAMAATPAAPTIAAPAIAAPATTEMAMAPTTEATTEASTEPSTPTAEQELRQTAQAQRIKDEQRAFEAKQKIADAKDARAQNRLDDALTLYTQAVQLDPSNTEAINGRNELLTLTGRQPGYGGTLMRFERDVQARRESISYSFDKALEDAQTAIDSKNIPDAKAAIERAKVARNTDPQIFRDDELRAFDSRIAQAQTSMAAAAAQLTQAQLDQQATETAARLASEQAARQAQKERTIADLIGSARTLTQQGNYREALNVIDQVLVLDPGNEYAVGVRPLVQDRADFAEQRKYREEFDHDFTAVLNQAEEKRIPYNDILRYPANWPDLSETRDKSVAAERGEEVADQAVSAQLERRLPDIKFDAVGFADAIDFLRDLTSANIFVNWRALEAAGVDKNAPITARLRDVPFAKVLRTILDDVSGGTTKLGYTIDEGVITISTEEDLAKNTSTRVYDIRDLIIDVPDFTDAPKFDLTQQNNSSGTQIGGNGGGGNNGGGQSLFGGGGGNGGETKGPTRQELVEAIIKLIQDTVASDTWKDNGGNVGSIRELGGQLIVTQTPENQRALVKLLDQLREQRALQVTIETRFLFVQRNYLDSLGVNFNFSFGNGPGGVAGNIPNPITVTQNSSSFSSPASLNTPTPGNLATSAASGSNLTTGLTFLSDFQANLVVQATQDEVNSSNLTAPRVTLFNGQRAYVLVSTETAYVSNLTPVVGNNATAFAPTISVVQSGVVLDVTATISADRKYVTLTLRPSLSVLETPIPTFTVSGLTSGSTSTVNGNTTVTTIGASIQEPEIQITTVRTTVSVPDGGTLLLGGQTLSSEVDKEAGVPVLSDIPFLKRLFTNRGMAKDDQVLLILVKPTIIIQREREQEQFPLLNNSQNH
jgi:general secretion pathway protein D